MFHRQTSFLPRLCLCVTWFRVSEALQLWFMTTGRLSFWLSVGIFIETLVSVRKSDWDQDPGTKITDSYLEVKVQGLIHFTVSSSESDSDRQLPLFCGSLWCLMVNIISWRQQISHNTTQSIKYSNCSWVKNTWWILKWSGSLWHLHVSWSWVSVVEPVDESWSIFTLLYWYFYCVLYYCTTPLSEYHRVLPVESCQCCTSRSEQRASLPEHSSTEESPL